MYEHSGLRIRACGQGHAEAVLDRVDEFKEWIIANKYTRAEIEYGVLLFCDDHPEWRNVVYKAVSCFFKEA